jgi:Txe/YoeB family toxin of toxin-antitoxin system
MILTKQAHKDHENIERNGLKPQLSKILSTVRKNPFELSQGFEKLKGKLKNEYSRRISLQHRFIYNVFPNAENLVNHNGKIYDGIVKIISMWNHGY